MGWGKNEVYFLCVVWASEERDGWSLERITTADNGVTLNFVQCRQNGYLLQFAVSGVITSL